MNSGTEDLLTGTTDPSEFNTLAKVKVMSASVAELNHLYPCNLYVPSSCGIAIVSVPFAI